MTQLHRAYAKINLGLRILEKRPDGYHNIETVFHRIDLFDEITFSSSPTIIVESNSVEAPGGEKNICYKAALMLREFFGTNDGIKISLNKKIPVGAGLGGGSSDAATILRELPAFWQKTIKAEIELNSSIRVQIRVEFGLKWGVGCKIRD